MGVPPGSGAASAIAKGGRVAHIIVLASDVCRGLRICRRQGHEEGVALCGVEFIASARNTTPSFATPF